MVVYKITFDWTLPLVQPIPNEILPQIAERIGEQLKLGLKGTSNIIVELKEKGQNESS